MQISSSVRIAVTGANGQLGHQLVKRFSGKVQLKAYDKSALNIADENEVEQTLTEFAPHIIINAAAYTAVDKAEQDIEQATNINELGPTYLARVAQRLDAVLIHVSTDYVFDGTSKSPYVETDNTGPQSVYGSTKLNGENAVIKHCTKHIILRTAWVFGEHGNNFVKTMLRLSNTRTELGVVADQIGGPTYAGDIAQAIFDISSQVINGSDKWGVYHFSGMPYVSWHQFALAIFDSAARHNLLAQAVDVKPITTADYPTPAKRPAFSTLNCSKIEQNFAVKPSDWQYALENISFYK